MNFRWECPVLHEFVLEGTSLYSAHQNLCVIWGVLGLYFGPEAGRCSCFTGTVWCKVLLRHNESSLPKPTTCSAAWHAPHLPCVQISSFNFVFFLHFYVRLFHLLVCSFICLFRLSILIFFLPCLFSFSSGLLCSSVLFFALFVHSLPALLLVHYLICPFFLIGLFLIAVVCLFFRLSVDLFVHSLICLLCHLFYSSILF